MVSFGLPWDRSKTTYANCEPAVDSLARWYPNVTEAVYRVLPELPEVFSYGDLHVRFNWFGRRLGFDDVFDFQKMLLDIGAVGKVSPQSSNTTSRFPYIKARFQYNLDSPLVISSKDYLCVHPAFHMIFSSDYQAPLTRVYPEGTDQP